MKNQKLEAEPALRRRHQPKRVSCGRKPRFAPKARPEFETIKRARQETRARLGRQTSPVRKNRSAALAQGCFARLEDFLRKGSSLETESVELQISDSALEIGPQLTLMLPGNLGGATWSGASFDPRTGYLYVNTNEVPSIGAMKPQPDGSPERYRRWSPWGEYMRFWDNNGYPCVRPPWGNLNAVDMNRGEIVWQVRLGAFDALTAKGIPPTGVPSLGGSIVTAGGLVFIAGTNDSRFRAFDAGTGKLLWETRLEASGHATPMTYLGLKTGKQFVVIAAGGGGKFSRQVSDVLAAYALPN